VEHKKYHDRCRWPRSGLGTVLLAEVWAWNSAAGRGLGLEQCCWPRSGLGTGTNIPDIICLLLTVVSTVTLTKYRSISEINPYDFLLKSMHMVITVMYVF